MAGFGNNDIPEIQLQTQAVTTDDSSKSSVVEFSEEILFPDILLRSSLQKSGIGNEKLESLKNFLNTQGLSGFTRYATLDGYVVLTGNEVQDSTIGYNSETGEFYLEDRTVPELLAEGNEQEQASVENISRKERLLSSVMYAIEHIFRENDKDWWGQRLNEKDTFTIDSSEFPWSEIPEFEGKVDLQIQDLQRVARRLLGEILAESEGIDDEIITELRNKIAEHEEKYLDYVVGIGDMYEGGANAFHGAEQGEENVTEDEITGLVERVIARKTVEECFMYMIEKHAEIEANNYQSTEVMRTYAAWNKALNRAVLTKMEYQNVEDKLFLQYAKIVSGRDVPEYATQLDYFDIHRGEQGQTLHSLDNDLLDPESASDALLFVFERPGGILSQISEQITIEDPLMENMSEEEKSPKLIFESCVNMLEEKVEGVEETGGVGVLVATGFGNILGVISEGKSYNDLSISEKMQLSILLRLTKKLKSVRNPSNYNSRYVSRHQGHGTWGNENGKISSEELGPFFMDAAENGQNTIIASINDNFDGNWGFLQIGNSESGDFNLEGYQAQIFDLYQDIWGNGGILDPSDTSIEWMKFGAQFGAIIIGSIALGLTVLPVLTAAGVLSTAAAATNTAMLTSMALSGVAVSRVVMPEGYDSNGDMIYDLVTDCATALLFGLAGGVLTQRTHGAFTQAGGAWNKGWTTSAGMTHMGSNVVDLTLLGFGSEIVRNIVVRNEEIVIPFTESTLRIPILSEWHIDEENRFTYEEFHEYVAPQLREYFLKQRETSLDGL